MPQAAAALPWVAGAMGLYSAYQASQMQQPTMAQPPAQAAQQAASTPQASQQAVKGVAQAGGSPGLAQTLLTGMAGVDPNSLQLGKNTLLGQ